MFFIGPKSLEYVIHSTRDVELPLSWSLGGLALQPVHTVSVETRNFLCSILAPDGSAAPV